MTRLANTAYHNKYSDTVKAMPNITVFFLQASRSIRTVWLLEELNVPYDIKFADRVNQKAPQDFKESSGSPLGKFPCIQDGDLTVHESGAITEYLCERYDKSERLIPTSSEYTRSRVQTWIHAAEATFMLHALAVLYATWNLPKEIVEKQPDVLEHLKKGLSVNVHKDFDWLESELGQSTGMFLVGNQVTAADIMVYFSARFILERELGTKGGNWPKVNEWLARCEATESFKRAVEKSGHTLHPKTT